jgi:hypothetical protein
MALDRRASTALTLSYTLKKQLCCDIFNEAILNGTKRSRAPDVHIRLAGWYDNLDSLSLSWRKRGRVSLRRRPISESTRYSN